MTALEYCEMYEGKGKEFELLTILRSELTPKGVETYNKIKQWLIDNLDMYCEALEKL